MRVKAAYWEGFSFWWYLLCYFWDFIQVCKLCLCLTSLAVCFWAHPLLHLPLLSVTTTPITFFWPFLLGGIRLRSDIQMQQKVPGQSPYILCKAQIYLNIFFWYFKINLKYLLNFRLIRYLIIKNISNFYNLILLLN